MKNLLHPPTLKILGARLLAIACYSVFWGYNAIFIALLYFGLIPLAAVDFIDQVQRGVVSPVAAGLVVFGLVVPPASCLFAWVRLRRDPLGLLALLLGVEGPTLLFTLLWGVSERSVTPAVAVIMVGLALGIAGQLLNHVLAKTKDRPTAAELGLLLTNTLGAAAGIYLATILLFFVLPWLGLLTKLLIEEDILGELYRAMSRARPLHVLGLLVAVASGIMVLGVPAGLLGLPIRRVVTASRRLWQRGAGTACALTVILGAMGGALTLAYATHQPQLAAFQATDKAPSSDAERRTWLHNAPSIHSGLVNTYLRDHRYLGSDRALDAVAYIYRELDYSDDTAERIQVLFNTWARPFVFDDSAREMRKPEALQRYKRYFDTSLQIAAKEELQGALQHVSSWRRGRAARPGDTDAERVRLIAQDITVDAHDSYANIEVHEAYQSQVAEQTETRLWFDLPPTAVLTGLWMGPSNQRSEAFPFVLAPKGAARKVYEAQVRRRIDPALLEQVGPSQYSLRVFPIPGLRNNEIAPIVHVWLTYQALPTRDGWPTPKLLQRQNAYFPKDARRTVNGIEVRREGWMPDHLSFASTRVRRAWRTQVSSTHSISAVPLEVRPGPPQGQRLALVIDRSYSMRHVQDELQEALEVVRQQLEPGNTIDVLLTSAETRGEAPSILALDRVTEQDLLPFGGQGARRLFEQAHEHLKGYDSVIVITDAVDSTINSTTRLSTAMQCPILLLSLNGPATNLADDITQNLHFGGGGTVVDAQELVDRLSWTAHPPRGFQGRELLGVHGGWSFFLSPHRQDNAVEIPELLPLAGAWFIRGRTPEPGSGSVGILDRLHEMATRATIVTPYSSMLVLINDAQRAQLEQANNSKGRFDRGNHTSDEEPLPHPATLDGNLQATPEPGSWALLGLAAAGALRRRAKNRQRPSRRPAESV